MNKTLRKIIKIAIFASMLAVMSPWSINISIIPITFALFAIYLIGAVTKGFDGLFATMIYIVLGIIGLPIFSSFRSGISVIVGPTGGYIVGYLPCILCVSLITSINKKKIFLYPLSMIIGTFFCYLLGTIWYVILTENSIGYAISVCVLPFILGDMIKIIVASIVAYIINTKTKIFNY